VRKGEQKGESGNWREGEERGEREGKG
jgi:hypothetical protein